jgi:hypothetical protein
VDAVRAAPAAPRTRASRDRWGRGSGTRRHELPEAPVPLTDRDAGDDSQCPGIDRLDLVGELGRCTAHPSLSPARSWVEVRPPSITETSALVGDGASGLSGVRSGRPCPCGDTELAEYVVHVGGDGPLADVELGGDLLVEAPEGHERRDLELPGSEDLGQCRRVRTPQSRYPHDAELLFAEHEPRELIGGRCGGLSLGPPAGGIRRWQVHNQVVFGRQVQLAHDLGIWLRDCALPSGTTVLGAWPCPLLNSGSFLAPRSRSGARGCLIVRPVLSGDVIFFTIFL